MLTYDEFVSYYEQKGKTINQMMKPKSQLNEAQLKRRYDAYVKSEEDKAKKFLEKVESVDEEWQELKQKLTERDGSGCRLIKLLQAIPKSFTLATSIPEPCTITIKGVEDLACLRENASGLLYVIDMAHIFPKGAHKNLYYDLDDVVWLNRYSHSMLDSYRDPIRGKSISSTELSLWWRFIAGNDVYERLLEKVKG